MQNALTGDQHQRHPTGAGIANHWSTRQISAPTNHQPLSAQEGMASDPRIPARNTITTMVYAVMGLSASLLTNVFLVVVHILTPDALEKERSKQEIVGANNRRKDACMQLHSRTAVDKFMEIQLAS